MPKVKDFLFSSHFDNLDFTRRCSKNSPVTSCRWNQLKLYLFFPFRILRVRQVRLNLIYNTDTFIFLNQWLDTAEFIPDGCSTVTFLVASFGEVLLREQQPLHSATASVLIE